MDILFRRYFRLQKTPWHGVNESRIGRSGAARLNARARMQEIRTLCRGDDVGTDRERSRGRKGNTKERKVRAIEREEENARENEIGMWVDGQAKGEGGRMGKKGEKERDRGRCARRIDQARDGRVLDGKGGDCRARKGGGDRGRKATLLSVPLCPRGVIREISSSWRLVGAEARC